MKIQVRAWLGVTLVLVLSESAMADGRRFAGVLERDGRRTSEACEIEVVSVVARPDLGQDCFAAQLALKPNELVAPGATSNLVTVFPRVSNGVCAFQALGGGIAGYAMLAQDGATKYALIARAKTTGEKFEPLVFGRETTVEIVTPGGRRRNVIEQRACGVR